MQQAQALIFDLGNVLIDTDFNLTIKAFEALNPQKSAWLKENIYHASLFLDYEKGLIDDKTFRNGLQNILEIAVPDEQLDYAWNALLLNFSPERIEILQALRPRYKLFLLSNTNAIHIKKVNEILAQNFQIEKLDFLFDKVYYSFEMHKRKPEPAIFEQILQEQNLSPNKVVFFDDSLDNVRAAECIGIESVQIIPSQKELKHIFAPLNSFYL
ncbi:MAG: HAD family phosphatase [Microscillaceae bacterium]|nr:HAD family phosphatase [Microscillaceae bacterium]MDW8461868.1 HAD family phosphatase [Cytophagales bacterium]